MPKNSRQVANDTPVLLAPSGVFLQVGEQYAVPQGGVTESSGGQCAQDHSGIHHQQVGGMGVGFSGGLGWGGAGQGAMVGRG
jgi:hypothetical protein